MSNHIRWIITDLDGCISPEESIPWQIDSFVEFARFCRNAAQNPAEMPQITMCTGRPQPYAEVLAKILDIRAPIICENGAVFYSLHNNHSYYGPGVTNEKIQGLRAVRSFLETEILPQSPGVLLQFGKEAQLSIFSEDPAAFSSITPRIEDFVSRRGGPELIITPTHFYLNISLKGVDKGLALKTLLGEVGANRQHTAGIGDTEGDLPMREQVSFFACPSNAKQLVKDAADYISPLPTIGGVLDILHKILGS